MAGDSVLAVFETASGAVAAALAVQLELHPDQDTGDRCMRFRIGVHLGDVIEKADGTVYGDGVNIAARLQTLAEPGGVSVSESIHTAVLGKVQAAFEDQGEQTVKNIPLLVPELVQSCLDGAAGLVMRAQQRQHTTALLRLAAGLATEQPVSAAAR